jgi:hypothetical protein
MAKSMLLRLFKKKSAPVYKCLLFRQCPNLRVHKFLLKSYFYGPISP